MTTKQMHVIRNALEAQIIRARSLQQNQRASELLDAQKALTDQLLKAERANA